jgi:predicted enzyme related to lactoylglutathione lyase
MPASDAGAAIEGQITFLPTADLEATDVFYRQWLGLELVRDQGVCRIYATCAGAYLGFCDRGHAVPERYRVVLTLLVSDVAAALERLRAAGAAVV